MRGLSAVLAAADEDYLVSLANKGLYKRAQRELPDAGIAVAVEENTLTASFADGTQVTVEGSIQNYRCTCPSRSVCKHLLMAVLAARDSGDETDEVPADFSWLLEVLPKELEKLAGKKRFQAAVTALQMGETARIEEGSVLAVTLEDTGNTVRFLTGAPLGSASCTCKSADFCGHKVQAVLHYVVHRKGELPEGFLPRDKEGALEFGVATLPYIRQVVAEVLDTGLARLPQGSRGRFLQLATVCHSQRLADMERLCARIGGRLEDYEKRSAAFAQEPLISDLCALLHLCDRVEAGDQGAVGRFRESYRPVPQLELWGLGAGGWHSAGGYTGVSIYFYSPREGRVLTYTTAMPDNASPGMEKLYHSGAPWGLPTKLSAMGHAKLELKGGKLSDRGQLSSSESGRARSLGAVDIMDQELDPVRFDDFHTLLDHLWTRMEAGDESPLPALLIPARTGAGRYDKIRQEWTMPLYDTAERRLTLKVRFESATRRLLENLMTLEEDDMLDGPMLARVTIDKGNLTAYPVAVYSGEIRDLSLEKPEEDKNTKGKLLTFDWGI